VCAIKHFFTLLQFYNCPAFFSHRANACSCSLADFCSVFPAFEPWSRVTQISKPKSVHPLPETEKNFRDRIPLKIRAARWLTFKPKIPIWENFVVSCNGSCWYILWPFGQFKVHLVHFVAIWYILWPFGIFSSVLVCCTQKNLATLHKMTFRRFRR
jgi:hypothetical protein